MGNTATDSLLIAENLDDNNGFLYKFRQIGFEEKIWLSLGGFPEKGIDDKIYNSHLIIDETGAIRAVYRKIHLFKVSLPNGPNLDESKTTLSGNDLVTCDSPVGKLGLMTCYDIRFPELSLSLRQAGAQVLLAPSAFTVPTGKAHWEVLLKARAIETQCYVVAAAQHGEHNEKRSSYGHSCIIGPWGEMLQDLADVDSGIGVAEINLEEIASVRERMPLWDHRKTSVYGKLEDQSSLGL